MTMARLVSLNSLSESLPTKTKLLNIEKCRKRATILVFAGWKTEEFQEQPIQISRRIAIGFAALTLSAQSGIGTSLADDNGFWLTTPIPIPPIYNKIANEETGTRSFIKNGLYIADLKPKGRAYRLRKCAFDLLAMEDLLGLDAWNYVRKYLRLKSTFMYYDFDSVISAAPVDEKQPLIDLANRLFDSVEKLLEVVKTRDLPQTVSCYQDTKEILQEVMNRMA